MTEQVEQGYVMKKVKVLTAEEKAARTAKARATREAKKQVVHVETAKPTVDNNELQEAMVYYKTIKPRFDKMIQKEEEQQRAKTELEKQKKIEAEKLAIREALKEELR